MSQYTGNTDHKFAKLPNALHHLYNLHDAYWTAGLLPVLIDQLKAPRHGDQWKWYEEVIDPLQHAVLDMQERGLLVDKQARSKFRLDMRRELSATDQAIRAEAKRLGFSHTDKFPNSKDQVARLLYDHIELKSHKKTDTGRPSADQDALLRTLRNFRKKDEPYRELVHNLCHRSRLSTMLQRYTQFDIDPDGRVRPVVKMAHAKTWRFALAEPALHQFPPETRHYFTATPGTMLLSRDFSQVEARVLAILANDEVSLNAFAHGLDIHIENAKDFFQLTDRNLLTMSPEAKDRTKGSSKSMLYRLQYGGEGATDRMKTYCPCPKCVDKVPPILDMKRGELLAAEERWFSRHPAVRTYHNELISTVSRKGYYETPFGVRRFFSQPWGNDFKRELKNVPMQTNTALMMNRKQVKLWRMGAPILMQKHDELILEVPDTPGRLVDQWDADLKGVMEEPVPELNDYSFPTEGSQGYNWAEL